MIYAKNKMKDKITRVNYDTIKFGVITNKSGIAIKLFVNDSSFCFLNAHLESGLKMKLVNIDDLHLKSF